MSAETRYSMARVDSKERWMKCNLTYDNPIQRNELYYNDDYTFNFNIFTYFDN